jgi:hypothetical protein
MASIGAFISGHVDIEKDNWVSILNINEYTYDIHIYLTRAGLGLRSLWFCAQPVMRKLAEVYIQAGGNLYNAKGRSQWQMRNEAIKRFEEVYILGSDGTSVNKWFNDMLNVVKDVRNSAEAVRGESDKKASLADKIDTALYVIQQIFGVDPENPSVKINTFRKVNGLPGGEVVDGTILEDIALNHFRDEDIFDREPRYIIDFRTKKDGQIVSQEKGFSVNDVQFFVYLANVLIDDPVQDMKKLVQYSKIETKKQGKNRAE